MTEVFRRILVVIMVTVGIGTGLWCLLTGIVFAVGSFFVSEEGLKTQVQYFFGGLALATLPNIALAYIAQGYFKKS